MRKHYEGLSFSAFGNWKHLHANVRAHRWILWTRTKATTPWIPIMTWCSVASRSSRKECTRITWTRCLEGSGSNSQRAMRRTRAWLLGVCVHYSRTVVSCRVTLLAHAPFYSASTFAHRVSGPLLNPQHLFIRMCSLFISSICGSERECAKAGTRTMGRKSTAAFRKKIRPG